MMKNILFVITTLLTIVACNKKPSQSDPNVIIVPYSDNEKLTFKKRTKYEYYDSLSYHYSNGVIFKKGKISKEAKQFGIWKLYSIDGTLREKRGDTHMGTIEKMYNRDFNVRSDMRLDTYLQKNNIDSLNDLINSNKGKK